MTFKTSFTFIIF